MGPFKDHVNAEEIFPHVFVVHNFLSDEECDELLESREDFFISVPNDIKKMFHFKKPEMVINKLKESVLDDLIVYESISGTVLRKGHGHDVHEDNPHGWQDREAHRDIVPGEPTIGLKSHAWGTILYLSNFEGGELIYTHYLQMYKPKKGDLVVHSSEVDMPHGVLVAKDDNRFIHTTFFYRILDVPKRYMDHGLATESDIMQNKYGWKKWLNE